MKLSGKGDVIAVIPQSEMSVTPTKQTRLCVSHPEITLVRGAGKGTDKDGRGRYG